MNKFKRFIATSMVVMGADLVIPVFAQSHAGGHGGNAHVGGAHGGGNGHGDGGWHRGGPGWWGVGLGLGLGWDAVYADPYLGYPYPTYVYPYGPAAVVVEPSAPPAAMVQPNPPPVSNWYYCDSAKGYYPYVKDCPEGWRTVPATPPGQ